jgi:hypothetical protein
MRRSGRGDEPTDLPIHRWVQTRELEDVEDVSDADWVHELLKRREQLERERGRRDEREEEELPIELREFLERRKTAE